MALVKFNRTATKATAIGASKDADTLYFPTDEQSVYLNGKRVGGDRVSHADTAESAATAGSATSAETAGTANKANQLNHALSLRLNGGSTKNFDGSAAVTFDVTPSGIGAAPAIHDHDSVYSKLGHTHTPSEVGAAPTSHNHDLVYSKLGHTHTPSEVGAAPSNHTHDIDSITHAGAAAKRGVDTSITTLSSSNLPTTKAVRDYVDSQIKNYTSAFRYAGTIGWSSNGWQVANIPADISETDHMSFETFTEEGEYALLKVGFSFYVNVGGTFVNGEQVEPGDMVTCVGLYNGEGRWAPSYHVVNGNITVTDSVDESSKVPTSKAVKSAISTAINALDGTAVADTNYVLTGVTETDGKIGRYSQVAVDQTYNNTSSNPASGKSIAAALQTLDSSKTAKSGSAITGITITDGKITAITETPVNNYTHPSHTPTTGVPTANAAPDFGDTFQVNQIASDAKGHVTSNTARTITIPNTKASNSTDGLMSKELYTKLNDVYNALTWV